MSRGTARAGAAALALLLVGLIAVPARAQDTGPNTGNVALSMGVDVTTDYYFRGILQEDQDYIIQPYGDVTFKLLQAAGPLTDLGVTLGLWNSLHGGPSGVEGGAAKGDPRIWYEADFYARVGAALFEDLSTAVIYTAYMSPNDSFPTVQELALSLGYDDSTLLGRFALNPSVLLAWEVKNQADAGRHRGVYLQLGVAPGLTVAENGPLPVAISFPLTVGLSLSDYYEFGTGDDDTFGYFSGGVAASGPLTFIPASYGAWQARASLLFLTLGDNLETVNTGDRNEVIGAIGIALTY